MISPENVPLEAIEAAKSAYTAEIYKGHGTSREFHRAMAAAVAAALSDWPNAGPLSWEVNGPITTNVPVGAYVIPLPQGSD